MKKALAGKTETAHGPPVKHEPLIERTAQPAVVVASGLGDRVAIAPTQIITAKTGHGGHGGSGDLGGHGHHDAEMSAREQRVAVWEVLEQLSDYWRKDPVERDLRTIQGALLARSVLNSPPVRAARARNAERKLLFGPLAAPAQCPGPYGQASVI